MTRITPVEPAVPAERSGPNIPDKALQHHFEQVMQVPMTQDVKPLRPTLSALGASFQKAHAAFAELIRGAEGNNPALEPREVAPKGDEQTAPLGSMHPPETPPREHAHAKSETAPLDTAQGLQHASVPRQNLTPPFNHAAPALRPQAPVVASQSGEKSQAPFKPEDGAPPHVASAQPLHPPPACAPVVVSDSVEKPQVPTKPEGSALPPAIAPAVGAERGEAPWVACKAQDSARPLALSAQRPAPEIPAVEAPRTAPAPCTGDSASHDDQPHDEPARFMAPVDDLPEAIAPLMTPGDKLLARLQPSREAPLLTRDLQQLLSALQPHIQSAATHLGSASVVQVHLPHLGHVEVQLVTVHGQLQVDIQASPGSLLQLQLARQDLLERLQRLNPEQPVQLSFSNSQDSDQRSRQRRSVYDEWEAQP